MLDLDTEEGRRQYRENMVRQAVHGIRPKALTRLLVLDQVVSYEAGMRQGDVWQEWLDSKRESVNANEYNFIQDLDVDRFHELKDAASDLLSEEEAELLFEVSDRTAQDYVKALRMLHL